LSTTAQIPTTARSAADVVEEHRRAGREFEAAGVRSFVREAGDGPTVLCMHGMWGSSFLWRKVLDELGGRGLRGVVFDLPGLGLGDRPADYDYSWSGLGRFAVAAVERLGLERFHLVVHDIGGPVGFELASALPERVASLTILNTMIDVSEFTPPWSMRPFRVPVLGRVWLRGLRRPMFRFLMSLQGVADRTQITTPELDAYLVLMRHEDGGRSFLRVMRSTETTPAKQALYRRAVADGRYPVQVVWAADDPALKLARYGERARLAAGLERVQRLPGKHFFQEDQAPAIADRIAALARGRAPQG
jgi:pimeloyl-ACP methyl ester carboxylesterase